MTRFELVTSPLPRGCTTTVLHGRASNYVWTHPESLDSPVFLMDLVLVCLHPAKMQNLLFQAKSLGGAGFEPA
jgi:hypothetical protein